MEFKSEVDINVIIGKNIKRYRKLYYVDDVEMTQSMLAEKIGRSVSLIGALESKNLKQGISIYNLYKISKVLDVPVDKFFE